MPKIQQLTGSLRQIAHALNVDRSVISRLVKERDIKPAGKVGAHSVYPVRALSAALHEVDPNRESPRAALDRARAALARMQLEERARRLIPADEAEREQARLVAIVARVFDTLPDIIERDCGAGGAILARIESVLDAARMEIRRLVLEGSDDQVGAKSPETAAHE